MGAFLLGCLPFTLAFDSAPIPPPPFPAGRGRFLVFLCKGLRPLHPRGWVRCGTGVACGKRDTAGGLLFWLPAAPAFSFLSCPHPPDPLPGGKGETKVISCKGLRPLHPRGWVGCGTGFACGKRDTAGGLPSLSPADLARNLLFFHPHFPAGRQGTNHRVQSILNIREKFWGVWGTLSRVPQRSHFPAGR